jgi:hypothetical protein
LDEEDRVSKIIEILRKEWDGNATSNSNLGGRKGNFDVHHEGYQSCIHDAGLRAQDQPEMSIEITKVKGDEVLVFLWRAC